ncbi:MAG: hypothetical protein AAB493_00215 [Patescibacteria group bacterium]|mgnify:CR=1 FL=1
MTVSTSFGTVPKNYIDTAVQTPQIVLSQKQNNGVLSLFTFNQVTDEETEILKIKANAIDTYFKERNMPLSGTGIKMVKEAEKNNLDWRLLAAIAVRESTGGIHACKRVEYNPFGWGSCKIGFDSNNEAIEVVARNLGGNNPKTAYHYSGKDTKAILQKYNPPSIVARYAHQVMAIMDDIGEQEIVLTSGISNT